MQDQSLDAFQSRIAGQKEKRLLEVEQEQMDLHKEMLEIHRRETLFNDIARRLFNDVIEPRMKLVEENFDNAKYSHGTAGFFGVVEFNSDRRFNATIEIQFRIQFDRAREMVSIIYHFRLLPILMEFLADDKLTFPLNKPGNDQIIPFVESKIAQGIETYYRFLDHPVYQKDNMVSDPVCGKAVNRLESSISVEVADRTYHFCSAECRDRFMRSPDLYIGVQLKQV